MSKEAYRYDLKFRKASLDKIALCNGIIADFMEQGFTLTVRQLYYQLVAGGHIGNSQLEYDNVVVLLTKARLAGMVDWDAIEDRTRDFISRPHWSSPREILKSVAKQYMEDKWMDQDVSPIVIVEKEALAGVFQKLLYDWDVPVLPARGYPSATVLRELARERMIGEHRDIHILHFGDHDPSGMDMSRDLEERLQMFTHYNVKFSFKRCALTMDQVIEVNPPPYYAKESDSRAIAYREEYGDDAWELDALSPAYLKDVIDEQLNALVDKKAFEETEARILKRRNRLAKLAANYKD